MPKKKKAKGIDLNLVKIAVGSLLAIIGVVASIFALPKLIGKNLKPPKFIKSLFKKK